MGIGVQFLHIVQISSTVEYMIGGFLQVHGTFLYFGVICIIGGIFSMIFVKESKGLTDFEKKNLYTPEDMITKRTKADLSGMKYLETETELTDRKALETDETSSNASTSPRNTSLGLSPRNDSLSPRNDSLSPRSDNL